MWSEYDVHSSAQKMCQLATQQLVKEATQAFSFKPGQPSGTCVEVVCVGSSTGKNDSELLLDTVLPGLRNRFGADIPVRVTFMDQLENDWGVLMQTVHQLFHSQENLFLNAAAGSFRHPFAPPSSAHLVLSFSCLHWLDQIPDQVPTSAMSFIGLEESSEAKQAIRRLSDAMLQDFFVASAGEMVSGARMVFTMDAESKDIPCHQFGGCCLALERGIEELVLEGKAPRSLQEQFFMKSASRTEEQVRACLEKASDALELEHLELKNILCPHLEKFKVDGDLEAFGSEIGEGMKACFLPLVESILKNDVSVASDKAKVDELSTMVFEKCAQVAKREPTMFSTEGGVMFVVIKKK